MITGIKSKFKPDQVLAQTLSQWIGCARFIYNAKCDEDFYLRSFAKRYLPIGTWPMPDQSYSQYKTELTPWLRDCPSQILRNSATIWHHAYQRFLKGLGGRPKRKNRIKGNYIWVTKELFRIRWEGRMAFVELGTVSNPVGTMAVAFSRKRIPSQNPASIWIRKSSFGWSMAFSYEDGIEVQTSSHQDHLTQLKSLEASALEEMITPIDRGVKRPVQTDKKPFLYNANETIKFAYRDKCVRRFQRKLARQQLGSSRRKKMLGQIAKFKATDANVRENFWHQTTRELVNGSQVVVIEDLKLRNMMKRPKAKFNEQTGKWEKNGAKAKAGLNRTLASVGLYKFDQFLSYKMAMANKPLFKISAYYTSQECADCGHTSPGNRVTQSGFKCLSCGHIDNADHNAAMVIRKRAVKLILDSGTELVGAQGNVLRLRTDVKRNKTPKVSTNGAMSCLLKKKAA